MGERAGAGSLAGQRAGAAVVLAALTVAGAAQAQFSRYADEIELKRLDFHPRPSTRNEIGTRFYGVIDLGVATGHAPDSLLHDKPAPNPDLRLGGIGSSFIGIRSDETLDRGAYAHIQLEHGFDADLGKQQAVCRPLWDAKLEHGTRPPSPRRPTDCSAFWNRRASVGLSHRNYGRLDVGLLEQPARQIAFMASPWGPDSVASPGEPRLYAPTDDANYPLPGRTRQSVTYQSPDSVNYRMQVQASLSPKREGVMADPRTPAAWHGGSFELKLGPWRAGVGYQRWEGDNRALPLSLVYTLGHGRLFGGVTMGERAGVDFSSVSVGWALRERSGPHPAEWKLGLNLLEQDHQRRRWTIGGGYEQPLSRRTSWQANVGVRPDDTTASRVRFDIGVRHAFAP